MRLKWLGLMVAVVLLMPTVAFGQDGDDIANPVAPPEGVNLPVTSLLYEADFSNTDFWRAGESPDGQLTFEPTDDGFSVASVPDGGIGSLPLVNLNLDDFYSEITFRVDSCDTENSALLMFTRVLPSLLGNQTNDTFVFVVQCDGSFRARALQGGEINEIVVSGQTITLNEGETYALGILMSGSNVVWYLNQQEVAQFEIPSGEARSSGSLTPGAQIGLSYTLTSWRIWALKSTGSNLEEIPDVMPSASPADDPLANNQLGDIIYEPSFSPPTSIPLGFTHDVATIVIAGGQAIDMYNARQPFGVLRFDGVEGENYYIETAFVVRACDDGSGAGFVWRADEDLQNYYAFEMQCRGVFSAYVVVDGEVAETFVSGRLGGDLTDIDQVIRLGVYARGDNFYIYGDSTQFANFSDDTLPSGGTGLLLSSDAETGQPMDIVVTDLVAFDVP